ncbi:MAG: histidine triad nucleotide-binding protein [Gammaproteobacteria bacterium]|nr:histidine triad nucleotide-binding protein [Gammaproteobacteria bacterium]
MTDCLFCKIVAGKIPANEVYRDDDVVAFRDISPQAPKHLLIIPTEHVATLNDFDQAHQMVLGKMLLTAQKLAKAEGFADSGYRTVINCNQDGGQTVYHTHMHVLGGRAMKWPPG